MSERPHPLAFPLLIYLLQLAISTPSTVSMEDAPAIRCIVDMLECANMTKFGADRTGTGVGHQETRLAMDNGI